MWRSIKQHPIRFFALICVGVTAFLLWILTLRLLSTLESYEWCGKALQAERISNQTFGGLTACTDLLKIQLSSLSMALHISVGSFALCLIVLVVIVIAGAKAAGSAGGISFNVAPAGEEAIQAAEHVREGAEQAEAEVKGATP